MMITRLLAVLLGLGCVVTPALGDDGQPPEDVKRGLFQKRQRITPDYRSYFYNYPHALPADYVFRTARVFAPGNIPQAVSEPAAGMETRAGQGVALSAAINQLGQALIDNAGEAEANEYVVAVSTFVSLDNLYATSSLGRYLSEQLLSALQQAGLEVVEVRKAASLMLSASHGEFALSRDMDELSREQAVQAVVVGTYAVAGREIFVNARLLRNEDNRVLSSATLVLPLDAMTEKLLANESMPASAGNSLAVVTIRQFPEDGRSVVSPPVIKPAKVVVKRKRPVKQAATKDCS
jgi:TolB-like protein